MSKIVALGTKEFVLGFKSAGVEGREVHDPKEAKELIGQLAEAGDTGVILLGESIALGIIDYVEKVSATKTIPSILVLRDERSNTNLGKRSIQRYIEQATGMKGMAGD